MELRDLLQRISTSLLFNADETMLSAKRTYKCLPVDENPHAVTVEPPRTQHITAMVTLSAVGESVPLFLVLSNLQHLPNSPAGLHSRAWFASSSHGWMTRFLFLDWVVCFCHWLTAYRARLGGLTSPAALIVDGHSTRLNPAALAYLMRHNVRPIILPAHSSHITQPFDVAVAASFKSPYQAPNVEKMYYHAPPQNPLTTCAPAKSPIHVRHNVRPIILPMLAHVARFASIFARFGRFSLDGHISCASNRQGFHSTVQEGHRIVEDMGYLAGHFLNESLSNT